MTWTVLLRYWKRNRGQFKPVNIDINVKNNRLFYDYLSKTMDCFVYTCIAYFIFATGVNQIKNRISALYNKHQGMFQIHWQSGSVLFDMALFELSADTGDRLD